MSEKQVELTVYGASDDLIEVDGDFREEFYPGSEDTGYLLFSDGTVLKVRYDEEGMWRINVLAQGKCEVTKTEATHPDDDYSDKVKIKGGIAWVLFAKDANMHYIK